MLRKLMGRKRQADDRPGAARSGKDEAIIHLTVPDEVLYPDREVAPAKDMSWLDAIPLKVSAEKSSPSETSDAAVDAAPVFGTARAAESPVAPEPIEAATPDLSANDEAGARPRFPYGWLVVVEGPGTGEWFPLERGLSHVGSAEGQTVRLLFGDGAIRPDRHAALRYDEAHHCFMLEGKGPYRVNGYEKATGGALRDGDVFTIGGTSLRLVALCSQNFHWSKDIAAE